MFLALRKERAGALIGGAALGALFISLYVKFGFSPARGILNPFLLLFWLPVLLYLLCGGAGKPGSETKEDFHLNRCRSSGGVCARNVPSRYPFG